MGLTAKQSELVKRLAYDVCVRQVPVQFRVWALLIICYDVCVAPLFQKLTQTKLVLHATYIKLINDVIDAACHSLLTSTSIGSGCFVSLYAR